MTRDALVVGINSYPEIGDLPKPAGDAEAIAQLLETYGDFRVRRLPEAKIGGKLCVDPDSEVTFKELEEAIANLFNPEGEKTQAPKTALLFFAGHGLRANIGGITKGFLASSDSDPSVGFRGFSLPDLRDLLQKSPVRQQIIWLDCCHSGELHNFDEADPGSLGKGKDRCFIAACRAFESAYESLSGEHGGLTEFLLQGLDPNNHAGGEVTNYHLTDFIKEKFKGVPQAPIYSNSGDPIILTSIKQESVKPVPEGDEEESSRIVVPSPELSAEILIKIMSDREKKDNFRDRSKPFSLAEWIKILIAYFNSRTDVANLLQVSETHLSALADGHEEQYRNQGNQEFVQSIKQKIQKFVSECSITYAEVNVFQTAPKDLLIRDDRFKQLCEFIIEGYLVEQDLRELIKDEVGNQDIFDDDNSSSQHKRVHRKCLDAINRKLAIWTPPSSFERYARHSFEKKDWKNIIHTSQFGEYYENHLHYSNAFIANQAMLRLRNLIKIKPIEFQDYFKGYIRILEGGVGGANTTQMLMRKLEADWKRQEFDQTVQPLKVQYLGYEINPGFAATTKDFFLGKVNSDSRSTFFNKFPLSPWNGQEEFVITENMFHGIKKLEEQEIYDQSVHFFICSYAFHHVPNGNALKAHLFLEKNIYFSQENSNFIEILDSILNNKKKITSSREEYFKAKALAEYFRNPQIRDSDDLSNAIEVIRSAIEGRCSETDIKNIFDTFLIDFKLEMLRKIRRLLVPGGILAIADPDGTSSFNAERIMGDVEMGVAHFLNVQEMVNLLKKANFEHIESYVVGKTKDPREGYLFDIVDVEGKDKYNFEDPNLGYIVLAQRGLYQRFN